MNQRYERQTRLPEIGEAGQASLSSAKAVVIGAGGLGSPVLYYLAAAGVGTVRIIDSDTVDITNLNRQIIHFEEDIGRDKTQAAKEKLQRLRSDMRINTFSARLDENNAAELLSGYDIVISCVDNIITRYILNSSCAVAGVPLINGGVQGFEGYVMTVLPGDTPCYECVFPRVDGDCQADTENIGVLGAVAGVLGSMMAVEAIKVITGIPVDPYFYYVDLLSCRISPIAAKRAPDCPACASAHRKT